MKPTALKLKSKQGSPFEALVAERLEAEREFRALDTPEALKLTAAKFCEEALALAGTTREKIDALREALSSDRHGLEATRSSFRRMAAQP